MLAPRLLLLLALAAFPGGAFAGTEVAPVPELPALKLKAPLGPDVEPAVSPTPETRAALDKAGWKLDKEGGLVRVEGADHGIIPKEYLAKAGLEWKEGVLKFSGAPSAVPLEMFAPMFKGLSSFTSAARVERAKAGAALAAWGLPPSVDGRRLYNPAGDATYFGMMLHSIFAAKPEVVAKLGVERTSQALDLLQHAYGQAFYKQAPDIAQTDLDRARLILFSPARGGETPLGSPALKARPDSAAMLKGYRAQLEADAAAALKAGDEGRRKDSVEALAVLNTLERQRLNRSLDLSEVPEPGKEKKPETLAACPPAAAPAKEEPYAPLASGLPGLLRVLDRVNGTPLTPEQQESLIKSFPMGDLVWRMGAQDLWKQGLTGKGVKVAVIDQGIAEHPELEGSVKERVNLTAQRGKGAVGSHGTHVAGIIHALAPDAELRSYAVFPGDMDANGALRENPEQAIIDAIHRAVKDGNKVINMSLGSGEGPSAALARVVEEYASKGTIFLIAAGNSRNMSGGIDAPSSAPSAITVGSLDSAGRMSDFSNFGERFDPRKLTAVVKDVFMAPGSNIVSTMPSSPFSFGKREPEYAAMSGTSMATPVMSGVSALLVQDMGQMTLVPNPVEMAQRLKSALVQGSTPMELSKLPPEVPIDQPFFVVNPVKALESLRGAAVPVADKK